MPLFLFRLPWLIAVTLVWPHKALADRPPARLIGTSGPILRMVPPPFASNL